jgi:hypothetical protein
VMIYTTIATMRGNFAADCFACALRRDWTGADVLPDIMCQ